MSVANILGISFSDDKYLVHLFWPLLLPFLCFLFSLCALTPSASFKGLPPRHLCSAQTKRRYPFHPSLRMISRLAWCTSRAARRALGLKPDHGVGGLASGMELHTSVASQHGDAKFDPSAPSWVSANVRWVVFSRELWCCWFIEESWLLCVCFVSGFPF